MAEHAQHMVELGIKKQSMDLEATEKRLQDEHHRLTAQHQRECEKDAHDMQMLRLRLQYQGAGAAGAQQLRTVHSPTCSAGNSRNPADSTGIRRTQIPECLGVTRAKSASLFREESGGVHWKPAYSSGVRGIRPDFFR